MQEFLAIALSFPTVLYSGLLTLCLAYWVLVIAGASDLDMLDGADGVAGAKGGLEGLAAAKGGLEGLAAAKGGLEGIAAAGKGAGGALEGAFDGADGVLDGAEGGKPQGLEVGSGGPLAVVYGFLQLRNAPVTVVVSFFALFAWLISTVAVQRLGAPGWVLGTAMLAGSGALSLLLTSLVIRPLAPVFALRKATSKKDLTGKIAVISTGSVSMNFGQALLEGDGDSLSLQVCAEPSANLKRGDRVILLHFDDASGRFEIEKLPEADELLLVGTSAAAELEAQAIAEAEAVLGEKSAKKRHTAP